MAWQIFSSISTGRKGEGIEPRAPQIFIFIFLTLPTSLLNLLRLNYRFQKPGFRQVGFLSSIRRRYINLPQASQIRGGLVGLVLIIFNLLYHRRARGARVSYQQLVLSIEELINLRSTDKQPGRQALVLPGFVGKWRAWLADIPGLHGHWAG